MDLSKLDLEIKLSPSQVSQIDSWLEIFYANCRSRMSDPIFEGVHLKISSADIYNFIVLIKENELPSFEWYGFRLAAKNALMICEYRGRDLMVKSHYRSCQKLLSLKDY